MKRLLTISGLAALISLSVGQDANTQDLDARRKAEQAARESMIEAMAEKARNDEIVRQQRLERERQREQQEQLLRDLEEAERRSRTS